MTNEGLRMISKNNYSKKKRKENQNFPETYKRTANPKLSNTMTKVFGTKIEAECVTSFQNENGLHIALPFSLVC